MWRIRLYFFICPTTEFTLIGLIVTVHQAEQVFIPVINLVFFTNDT